MHRFQSVRAQLISILESMVSAGDLPAGLSFENVSVDFTREAAHGDMAINAAMVLAKPAGQNPRALAEKLSEKLKGIEGVAAVEIAGPGFINLRFADAYWQSLIPEVMNAGTDYGALSMGAGEKMNVEYVSANPTGPLHVGHVRGAVFGDALARLLSKAGYDVCKEYYINDAGAQVDKLADSAFVRYREACGEVIGEIPEGLYPGGYLVPVGQALKEKFGDSLLKQPREQYLPAVKEVALASMMELIKGDLRALGIEHDIFTSEAAITKAGKVEEAIDAMKARDLIYVGVLDAPKGKEPDDWEPRPQTLFKASEFGDDVDRALIKADGSWTYFAPDIALHYDKYKRGFNRMVNVWGADHGGYVKRIKAAVSALTGGEGSVEVKLCQMVKFLRDGEPAKMSKRAGTFVTAQQLLEEVGKDVVRFMMLTRKNDAPLDFDFAKVSEQSKDNPVFYVHYAHARIHSVLRHAESSMTDALAKAGQADADLLADLKHPAELALLKRMAAYPKILEGAAAAFEPHRVAFYLQELAAEFHSLWNQGNEDTALRFLQEGAVEATAARLALIKACATVLASGLDIMGVTPKEELRA